MVLAPSVVFIMSDTGAGGFGELGRNGPSVSIVEGGVGELGRKGSFGEKRFGLSGESRKGSLTWEESG